jgi:hypothetical protein
MIPKTPTWKGYREDSYSEEDDGDDEGMGQGSDVDEGNLETWSPLSSPQYGKGRDNSKKRSYDSLSPSSTPERNDDRYGRNNDNRSRSPVHKKRQLDSPITPPRHSTRPSRVTSQWNVDCANCDQKCTVSGDEACRARFCPGCGQRL